jgi:hypothetical protein
VKLNNTYWLEAITEEEDYVESDRKAYDERVWQLIKHIENAAYKIGVKEAW